MNTCCCCISLRTGTTIIAILNMPLPVQVILYGISWMIQEPQNRLTGDINILALGVIAIGAVWFFLAFILLIGAIKRNEMMCLIWYALDLTILILVVFVRLLAVLLGSISGSSVASSFIAAGTQLYFLWVVRSFASQIQKEVDVV